MATRRDVELWPTLRHRLARRDLTIFPPRPHSRSDLFLYTRLSFGCVLLRVCLVLYISVFLPNRVFIVHIYLLPNCARRQLAGNRPAMPVRRGHVAPRTTIIETIIRKFDTHGKITRGSFFFKQKKWGHFLLLEIILLKDFVWSARDTGKWRRGTNYRRFFMGMKSVRQSLLLFILRSLSSKLGTKFSYRVRVGLADLAKSLIVTFF